MTARCMDASALANSGVGQESGSLDQESGFSFAWGKFFKGLWPDDTAKTFARRTDTSLRHAERVLAGDRGLSLPTFLTLCDTPDGAAVLIRALEASGCNQPWFKDMKVGIERGDIKRRQRALRVRLERLEEADE